MRVLHVVHQYPPEYIGGTELSTAHVARELARRGHEVGVFYRRGSRDGGLAERMEDGVRVWAAWAGELTAVRRFAATFGERTISRAFARVVEEFRPELAHIQHLMGLPLDVTAVLHRRGVPYVVTLHDYWWVCANAQLITNYDRRPCGGPRAYVNCARCAVARAGSPLAGPSFPAVLVLMAVRARLLWKVLLAAEAVIAPSEFLRRWYVDRGVPAARVGVLPHGFELGTIAAAGPPGTDRPLRVAYIGGLAWAKGLHVLVQAVRGLEDRVELWVIGDASAEPDYGRRVRAEAGPGVRFWGRLPHEEVQARLREVDLLGVPSLWAEPFGRVVSEAFAAGVPVLAAKTGGIAERVQHGVNGLLLPPGDVGAWRAALVRLTTEPGLLRRLRQGVKPPLSLQEHVDRLEQVYARVIGHRDAAKTER